MHHRPNTLLAGGLLAATSFAPTVAWADGGLLGEELASNLWQVAVLVGQTAALLLVFALAATAFRLWEASRVQRELDEADADPTAEPRPHPTSGGSGPAG